jgi:hypothetical protein
LKGIEVHDDHQLENDIRKNFAFLSKLKSSYPMSIASINDFILAKSIS